jgi:hypothetical protein
MRIFLIILGILMLLPGACGLIFTYAALTEKGMEGILGLSLPSLAIGIGGIFLIRHVIKRVE